MFEKKRRQRRWLWWQRERRRLTIKPKRWNDEEEIIWWMLFCYEMSNENSALKINIIIIIIRYIVVKIWYEVREK